MRFQWMKLRYTHPNTPRKSIASMERGSTWYQDMQDCLWELCCSISKSDETVIIVKDNSIDIEGYEFQWLVIVFDLTGKRKPISVWDIDVYNTYEECKKMLDSQNIDFDNKFYAKFITIHKKC